jgi:GNAT superfamily N-acetyltransferase
VWQCVVRGDGNDLVRFVTVRSTRYPDGSRVELRPDLADAQIGDDALCDLSFDEAGRVSGIKVMSTFAPKAPEMWFGEVRESAAAPPAVSLVAFTGGGQRPHTLMDAAALRALPVRTEDQLGAVRWYPATGEIDQIYVQPAWRRRNIATALLSAAGSLSVARDWPRVWADGQRTLLGEQLRNASPWKHRGAALTHVAPPMTPGES